MLDFNIEKMAQISSPLLVMKATHFTKLNSNYKPSIDKAGRIGDTQFLDSLQLKIGSRVMLIHNILVADGLVNGAIGELIGVEKLKNGTVDKLVVRFDSEHTGEESRKCFPILTSKFPGGTPIFKKELEYSLARSNSLVSSTAKLVQFPIIPAFGVTSHRFQGQTISWPSQVVVDLRKVFQTAQSYVMLSRVQSLQQLYILGELPEKKLYVDSKALAEVRRMEKVSLNNHLSPWDEEDKDVIKVVFLNVIIKNKFQMITTDYHLMKADALLLSETWLDENTENISLNGYKHSLQGGGRGGGTAVFYRNNFIISDEMVDDGIYMAKLNAGKVDIINIYRAQYGNMERVVEMVKGLIDIQKTCIVGGDINKCFIKDQNNPLTEFLLAFGFSQMVKNPTHLHGSLLDHIYFCQGPDREKYEVTIESHGKYYTDHDAITIMLRGRLHLGFI